MAEEKKYLCDLNDGYYVVKEFAANNILVHPKYTARQPAGDSDILVTLDDRGSSLILTDNFNQVFNGYKDEYEANPFTFNNPIQHLFMQKIVYPDSPRVFVGFYSPYAEFGGCTFELDSRMQKIFNHLMAEEILDLKTLGAITGWIKG